MMMTRRYAQARDATGQGRVRGPEVAARASCAPRAGGLWRAAGLLAAALLLAVALAAASATAAAADEVPEGMDGAAATTQRTVPDATFGVFADHIKLPLFDTQQLLTMPVSTNSFYFTIPAGLSVRQAQLSLYVTSSQTLIDGLSSISASVNGTRLDTVPIRSIGQDGNGWWTVEIPADVLNIGGLNDLTFDTAHRSIEGECADIDNPSNWVGLEASSYLTIDVAGYPGLTLATIMPAFYDSVFAGTGLTAQFVLPESGATPQLSSGALTLASAAGAYKTGANRVAFTTRTGAAASDSGHSLYLGWQEGWSGLFKGRAQASLGAGQGYLEVADSPDAAGGSKLLVSGADESGFKRAVSLASSAGYLGQLSGTSAVVTSDASQKQQLALNEDGTYTFEELGFSTMSLAGAFHQTATFALPQPNNVQCGPASTVTVNFRHSRALQADRSLLTVKIGDVEVDSVQLSNSNAAGGSLTVTIPEAARRQPSIKVTVDVYNYIGKIDCSKDYYDVAWTVVENSSSVFYDPSDLRIRPRLNDFLQFNLWSWTSQSAVVLHTGALSGTALDVAARAGQRNAVPLTFVEEPLSATPTALTQESDCIYLGPVGDLMLPSEVQSQLVAAPQADGTYQIADDAPLLSETLAGKVVFQVVRSPWNFDKYVYVISYPEGSQDMAERILQDGDLVASFAGTITCVDDDGVIATYDAYAHSDGEEAPLSVASVSYKVYSALGISLWWLIVAVVLLAALIIACIRLALRRRRFKDMERKIASANQAIEDAERQQEAGSAKADDAAKEGDAAKVNEPVKVDEPAQADGPAQQEGERTS